MDYAALPQDPDHPTGSSPWATSPKLSRDYSASANNDVPTNGAIISQSPTVHAQAPADFSDRPPTSDTSNPTQNGDSHQSPYYQQQEAHGQAADQPHQSQQSQYASATGNEGRRQEAQRYHSARPQHKSHTQYKLQCKITALERTGKKDPILRFDAYVRNYNSQWGSCSSQSDRPIFLDSARHSSETSDGHTPNSSKSKSI